MNLLEIKKRELEILVFFKEFCIKNNLKYYLAYGTLLGTVRHKGFIPWDDDIDVFMPRKDYDKFLELFNEKNHSSYKTLSCLKDSNYYYEFAKVIDENTKLQELGFEPIDKLGIYIDVFPLESINKNSSLNYIYTFLRDIRTLATNVEPHLNTDNKNKARLFKFLGIICRIFRMHKMAKLLEKIVKKLQHNNSPHYILLMSPSKSKVYFLKEDFGSGIDGDFENIKFNIPENYDKVLTLLYGNYMELPPENKRESGHKFTVEIVDSTL